MQAIQTSFIPCTNTNPNRIKAECQAGKIIISWDYGLNVEENHSRVCDLLIGKLNWNCDFVSGQLKDGSYCHVLTNHLAFDKGKNK